MVGADGLVALARAGTPLLGVPRAYVVLVRPDGRKFREELIFGRVIGALAVSPGQVVYASTSTGTLNRIDFFCPTGTCKSDDGAGTPNSTPPLLA